MRALLLGEEGPDPPGKSSQSIDWSLTIDWSNTPPWGLLYHGVFSVFYNNCGMRVAKTRLGCTFTVLLFENSRFCRRPEGVAC
jgi:hypothetical protein